VSTVSDVPRAIAEGRIINPSDDSENVSDLNGMEERDSHGKKHDEPRISTLLRNRIVGVSSE
jgi:hypothetical protein